LKENLNLSKNEGTEGAYEQFDTDETYPQDKKNKKPIFYPQNKL